MAWVRRLDAGDVAAFRAIRREGLQGEPANFEAAPEEDDAIDDREWRKRLETGHTYGVFDEAGLVGIASFRRETRAKTRHRGHLAGVYVRPHARGTGAAQRLIEAVLDLARKEVDFLYLVVSSDNAQARRFYERNGFTILGIDPGGLLVDGTVREDCLMMLRLNEAAESDET